jgi:hypothetical protein
MFSATELNILRLALQGYTPTKPTDKEAKKKLLQRVVDKLVEADKKEHGNR